MDMRFHWLRDQSKPGSSNLADYWTKHHPASHHRNLRSEFLTPLKKVLELRACATQTKLPQNSLPARVC